MLDTTLHHQAFFSWFEKRQSILFVSEASDFKREAFLNGVVEKLEDQKRGVCFRLGSDTDWEDLVNQITERFFIPVRTVSVGVLQQLQGQLNALKKMKQSLVLLVENAHQLSHQNLLFFLTLAADENSASVISVALFGKPTLAKRLIHPIQDLEGLTLETLSLSSAQGELERPTRHFMEKGWTIKKPIRLISIAALVVLIFFLWQFEKINRSPLPKRAPMIQNTHSTLPTESKSNMHPAVRSEWHDFLFYLKSMKQRVKQNWALPTKEKPASNQKLPALPLPPPTAVGDPLL